MTKPFHTCVSQIRHTTKFNLTVHIEIAGHFNYNIASLDAKYPSHYYNLADAKFERVVNNAINFQISRVSKVSPSTGSNILFK